MFIAGPAFNAGRYGVACGAICKAVKDALQIPVLTGMYEENPGVDMYGKEIYIVSTRDSAAGMRSALPVIGKLLLKLARGERIGASVEEGYFPQGIRVNFFEEKRGSARAVEMLVKKLADEPFVTEYPMPSFDRVDPMPAIRIVNSKYCHCHSVALSHMEILIVLKVLLRPNTANIILKALLIWWWRVETAHGGYDHCSQS